MFSLAQATPKTVVRLLRFWIAASRMENTQSPSQFKHRSPSFISLSKNSFPSCRASRGMCSMMARRTLQLRSSARSTMAGRSSLESLSMPMTNETLSSRAMTFSRTSGYSSFKSTKTSSSSSFTVASLPSSGASPMMLEASAALACCDGSVTSSRTTGITSRTVVLTPSGVATTRLTMSATLKAAAVRTSASLSLSRAIKPGKRSSVVGFSPKASHRSPNWSATM
mmetsp:Transcript_52869/g.129702  ORF Transcript_52869/g.129702 Transcript_52869/m.129702 type:complete len:225 (-) Transcript_52869:875-1549(-)